MTRKGAGPGGMNYPLSYIIFCKWPRVRIAMFASLTGDRPGVSTIQSMTSGS